MSGAALKLGLLERPPLIAFAAIAVGLLLDRYVPLGWVVRLPEGLRFALMLILSWRSQPRRSRFRP